MAKKSKCLTCEFLQADAVGIYHCQFTGESWREYSSGCQSCVNIPPTEQLLNPKQQGKRKQFQKEIRQNLKAGKATLVLGAGISVPMNMPDWLGLVSRMSGYALQYQTYKQVEPDPSDADREYRRALEADLSSGKLKLFSGVNVLESGQYIAQILATSARGRQENELIKGAISDIIEDSLPPEAFLNEHPGLSLEDIAKDNTLCAVAYLMQADGGFRRALTYNFDTLVQEYLISVFNVPTERVITYSESWNQGSENADPIQLFHVHGCIPRRKNQVSPNSAFPKESERIILSEDSYYDTERYEAYNWQNSIQSFYLNRDCCVFVGFSADDYNFRRILRQMGDHRSRNSALPRHYLIFAIDQLVRDTWAVVCHHYLSADMTPEKVRRDALILLNLQLEMKANYWKRYGFYPIWVTIQDIPDFLLSLLETV